MSATKEGIKKATATKLKHQKEMMKMFLEAYPKHNCNIVQTAKALNMSTKTIYQWKVDYPEFKEQCELAYKDTVNYVESKLFELIEAKNPAAIMFFLKCKGGYVENQQVNVNAKVATAVLNIDPFTIKK